MVSTLALCLQWRNETGEKPGHLLHIGENAGGPADSPKQHYCIIIAFLSLPLSPTLSAPLASSHSSDSEFTLWPYEEPLLTSTSYTVTDTYSLPYRFSPLNLKSHPHPALFLPSFEEH